ncbi:izumo sperm-egg fusion protein 3 [Gracilinanus agilis]|uniref:izumo sperm-egg fusion protein 3 n=1 Tax=Gracilinanus agilis TaxID=191870 RepID=UPI001CFD8F47|nr:izumo sperm-egg fusion protein 3 [Gracilinanus agilis]
MEIKGIKSCLECDPKYFKDVIWLLDGLVPQNTPSRKFFLDRQLQELRGVSTRVHQGKKRLRLLGEGCLGSGVTPPPTHLPDVRQTVQVREWLKEKLSNLKQKPWKGVFIFQGQLLELRQELEFHLTETLKTFSDLACSEDCMMTEGPVLDCWNCLRITTPCFKGELCGDDDPMVAQQREISLFLALMMEAVGLGSIALLADRLPDTLLISPPPYEASLDSDELTSAQPTPPPPLNTNSRVTTSLTLEEKADKSASSTEIRDNPENAEVNLEK